MTGLLTTDGVLYRSLARAHDLVLISLLWWALSLPVVTVPAATDWMMDAVSRTGRDERVPSVHAAVRHLRNRFVPTGRLALGQLAVIALLAVGALGPDPGGPLGLGVRILVVGVGVTWALVAPWSVVLPAERDAPSDVHTDVRAAIRTAYLRALRHLPLSFLSAVSVAVGCVAVLAVPGIVRLPVVLLAPATVAAVVASWCRRAAPLAIGPIPTGSSRPDRAALSVQSCSTVERRG